jgi:hypothetical protein
LCTSLFVIRILLFQHRCTYFDQIWMIVEIFPGEVLDHRKHTWDRIQFNLLPRYFFRKKVSEMVTRMGFLDWYCDNVNMTTVIS